VAWLDLGLRAFGTAWIFGGMHGLMQIGGYLEHSFGLCFLHSIMGLPRGQIRFP